MYTLLLGIIKIIIPTLYTSISITDSKGNLILHLDSPTTLEPSFEQIYIKSTHLHDIALL